MFKEFETSAFQRENPYVNLGFLEFSKITEVEGVKKIYILGKDSPVLIEGLRGWGTHEFLAQITLQEDVEAILESVGRSVVNPVISTNVIGTFKYSLRELAESASRLRTRSYDIPPRWSFQNTPVEMFLARQNYSGLKSRIKDLDRITDIHIIANLSQDPRTGLRNPSKNFRFRK